MCVVFFFFIPGLTDEEVQVAIQRSGSTEEALPLTPVGPPHPVHMPHMVNVPQSECTNADTVHDMNT